MNSVKVAKMKPASVFSFVVVVIFLNSVTEIAAATGTDAAARTYNLQLLIILTETILSFLINEIHTNFKCNYTGGS